MKTKNIKKIVPGIFGTVLAVSMMVLAAGCGSTPKEIQTSQETETVAGKDNRTEVYTDEIFATEIIDTADIADAAETIDRAEAADATGVTVLGEGQNQFLFSVADKNGNETHFEIHTDKKMVGEALLELGLIAGDEGPYGLYVKTVNGITADFDQEGTYWAFYIKGEYAQTGVDVTPITQGESYSFQVEK